MRWVHVNLGFRIGVYPTSFNPAARKDESVAAILIDNSQL
jgi:hypothetical protein